MMRSLPIILFALLINAGAAWAQGGAAVSTVPADGEAGVALAMSVSITFDRAIDVPNLVDENGTPNFGLAITPASRVAFNDTEFTLSNGNRTISFNVVHQPNTDYNLIVLGVPLEGGTRQLFPAVANYTTASEIGERTVSGMVSIGEGVQTDLGPLGTVVVAYNEASLGGGDDIDPNQIGEVARVAVVTSPTGAFTIPYMRDGSYLVGGVRANALTLFTGGEIDFESDLLIGFYNPDEDFVPDTVVVAGEDVTGIGIVLFNFLTTAKAIVAQASRIAEQIAGDAELYGILGGFLDLTSADGRSPFWLYQYFSTARDELYEIGVAFLGGGIDTLVAPDIREGQLPIPEDFVDSDVAMAVAEANGGADFRAFVESGHPPATAKRADERSFSDVFDVHRNDYRSLVDADPQSHSFFTVVLQAGHRYWEYPPDPNPTAPVFWRIDYVNLDFSMFRFDSLTVFVDIESGELLHVSGAVPVPNEEAGQPRSIRLDQNYPNPFNPATTIRFDLARPMQARLTVYDALGRPVAVLVDGQLGGGSHAVQWRPEPGRTASGVYLYRLETPDGVQTRIMTLQQ